MKKNTLATIRNLLNNIDFTGKAAVLEELDNELNKGAAEKAERAAVYDAAWTVVSTVLEGLTAPATAAEIFVECEGLPDDFSAARLARGLNTVWADHVEKIPGNPNMYTRK